MALFDFITGTQLNNNYEERNIAHFLKYSSRELKFISSKQGPKEFL